MRRESRIRRGGRRLRLPAVALKGVPEIAVDELPRCCTCGKPLSRLVGCAPSAAGFQCEQCFYPGTGRRPARSGLVASERARWLTDIGDFQMTGDRGGAEPNDD